MSIVIRTAGDPLSVAAIARSQVHSLDQAIPVTNIRTMDEIFSASVAQQRFSMLLVGLFGALAVVLAAIGIYGVMGYTVTQRKHEIAVRMALGAKTGQVLKLILKDGLVLASLGVVIGLVGAFAMTRLLSSLLFEVWSIATSATILSRVTVRTAMHGTPALGALATPDPHWSRLAVTRTLPEPPSRTSTGGGRIGNRNELEIGNWKLEM